MRVNLVTIGAVIFASGFLLDYFGFIPYLFTVPIGVLNILLGAYTRKAPGINLSTDPSNPVRLLIDKGVMGASFYELVFLRNKLILKKLGTRNLTLLAPFVFVLAGLFVLGPFGAPIYGLTAFSIQEYVTQRRRDRIVDRALMTTIDPGDLEFGFDGLKKVELARNRLQLLMEDETLRISIPRRYSRRIGPLLKQVMPSKYRG